MLSALSILPYTLSDLLHGRPRVKRSSQWPTVRAAHLKREPACAACGTTKHLAVHHLYPAHAPGGYLRELDQFNLLTVCETPSHNCHFIHCHGLHWAAWLDAALTNCSRYRVQLETRRGFPYRTRKAAG